MKPQAILPCLFGLMTSLLHAELRLSALLSDHAMLQAGKPIAILGWAGPGAQVKVAFIGPDTGESDHFRGKWRRAPSRSFSNRYREQK
ncbi:MAG: hypothetical protein LV481_01390 [Methylacidiphilales bacterium]|nr:hypothetical protein [Candidatus Methylacidiphilales bacterium]